MAADGGSGSGSNIVVRSTRAFARPEQTFPTLTDAEIARMRRFGEVKSFSDGELMFETGKPGRGMFVVLSGHIAITERDGLGHVTPIVEQGPGQFVAEVGQRGGLAEFPRPQQFSASFARSRARRRRRRDHRALFALALGLAAGG